MPLAARKTAFKRSTKTPRVHRKAKQDADVPPPNDYEDRQATEDEDWVEDLREYLKNHLQQYLEVTDLDERRRDLLKSVVHGYRNQLGRNRYEKHSRNDAWNAVLEIYKERLRGGFAPDSDIEEPP